LKHFRWHRAYWYGMGVLLYGGVVWALAAVEAAAPQGNISSIGEALWYSIVTLSTVGYGDYYPVTPAGKWIALTLIMGSVGVLGVVVAELTNKVNDYFRKQKLGMLGTSFKNHFVIIGWDDFAAFVADQLIQAGTSVAVICDKAEQVELLHQRYEGRSFFVLLTDFGDVAHFAKANIEASARVWINNGPDSAKLITAVNLKKHFGALKIALALDAPDLKETFKAVGVTYIISKTEITARLMASYLFEPDVALYSEDLLSLSLRDTDYDLQQYRVTESNPYLGEDYETVFMAVKRKYNAILMGLSQGRENGNRVLLKNPAEPVKLQVNDYLILASDGRSKADIAEDFGVSEGV